MKSLDAELVQGDLLEPQSLKRAVAGIDTIIHLGAVAAFVSYRLVRPSIVDGSRNLMEAAREAGVKKFVYGGTLLVYGSQKQPIDQTTPSSPVLGYGRAKLEAGADDGGHGGRIRNALCLLAPAAHLRRQEPVL
ncbi:MAG: NAD-dependent epimerase/dehydratase family protein [Desulfobacterales bacterium]|nr:NAD-dependent epimerase/dehydratase family protein [Desulfobacterales bacterium]